MCGMYRYVDKNLVDLSHREELLERIQKILWKAPHETMSETIPPYFTHLIIIRMLTRQQQVGGKPTTDAGPDIR